MLWAELQSHLHHLSERELLRVKAGFELAEKAHRGQLRKSGEPYFVHPLAVAHLLADIGADGDTIIAGLLHDAVEDTPLTILDVERKFGKTVGLLVDGATKLSHEHFRHSPNMTAALETLRKIFVLMQTDVRIMLIKMADRLHNMQTVEFLSPERQRSFAEETLAVYAKIADRLSMQDWRNDLEALSLHVLDPKKFEKLCEIRQENEQRSLPVVQAMTAAIESHDTSLGHTTECFHEQKTWEVIEKQRVNRGNVVTGLSLLTVVCVCDTVDICYRVLGALHQRWREELTSFQDYINHPRLNGYRGLHTTLILEDGTRVRCKIRTREMQAYARRGVATICFSHSSGRTMDLPWAEHLNHVTDLTQGDSQEFWQSLQQNILGESITIHGPDDRTILLPKGATALDGAFALFGEEVGMLKEVSVNGKAIPLHHLLTEADSLSCIFAQAPTVELSWLEIVATSVAKTHIRNVLMQKSPAEKKRIGLVQLNAALQEAHQGHLSEFSPKYLNKILRAKHYSSLDRFITSVAEGETPARDIVGILFPEENTAASTSNIVHCTLPPNLLGAVTQELSASQSTKMTVKNHWHGKLMCKAIVQQTPEQQEKLLENLRRIGPEVDAQCRQRQSFPVIIALVLVFVLWGFDPVATWILIHPLNIAPLDLHIAHFAALTFTSGFFVLWQRLRSPLRFKRLSLSKPLFWASAAAMFMDSFSTFFAFRTTLPSHYTIPMTAAGFSVAAITTHLPHRLTMASWFLFIASFALLFITTPEWGGSSVVFTCLAIIAFSTFFHLSDQYKHRENVKARVLEFFFLLVTCCFLFSLPLLPFSTILSLTWKQIAMASGYSIFISALPFYLFYQYLPSKAVNIVSKISFLIMPITVMGEAFFVHYVSLWTLIAGTVVLIGALVPFIYIHVTQQSQR